MSFLNEDKKKFDVAKSAIQSYAQVLSSIKGALSPHQKNWEEFSLKVYAKGLTTSPIPIKRANYFDALDLNINLIENKLKIFCSGERLSIDLRGQSQKTFSLELKSIFDELKIVYDFNESELEAEDYSDYNETAVLELWSIIREVYFSLLKFKGEKLDETSNINFWAHHFDIAMLVFNGKIISDQDPNNWDYSREQMNFGLSFGDSEIANPYLYVTQYPFNSEMYNLKLLHNGYWHKEGWSGAVKEIREIESYSDLNLIVNEFFSSVYKYSKK